MASGSPRRKHLLSTFGFSYEAESADIVEERFANESAHAMVERLALEKAMFVSNRYPNALILGADTAVVLGEDILGKPPNPEAAKQMLYRLSGETHSVLTGIALIHPSTSRARSAVESTDVTIDHLSDREIEDYVGTGSTMDKAGGYGIQDDRGALFVSRIDGDFYNVMGLPLHRLYQLLKLEFSDLISRSL